jgi:hypothetical protein
VSRRIPVGFAALAVAIAALAVGCGDDDASPPSPTMPPELHECADPKSPDAESTCLDQIEQFIEADIAGVEDALQSVNDALKGASASSFEFKRVSPTDDAYDPITSTEPIELHWRVGTTERTMFVCFGDGAFEVGQDACPA